MVAYETIQYKRWALGIQPASAVESNFTEFFTVAFGSTLVALVVRLTIGFSSDADGGRCD